MIDKEKAKLNMKVQWAKFIGVTVLYLLLPVAMVINGMLPV